ncbi:hypothetical protein NDI54_13850 [Haloarcula sp. S1AR25-5A]|uniref:DUF8130 domain-containing protein n=1 Tax=Haloarcula terrestris TaxID=2950533 RepID=A0AAE4JJX9_9EURY|nr:hypothetical protein [Haloarcula terrestris]MDS0222426.1 hypothetical protein [Haloarcula terrestris]
MRRRALLTTAGASMASLAGCLGDTEYTITDVAVTATAPFEFDVTVMEPDAVIEHPARLEFELRNRGERPLRVRNTGVWPFGLLKLVRSPDAEGPGGTLLYTAQYETSQYVDIESRSDYGVESTPLVQALDSGQTVSETYELHGDGIRGAGTAYVRGEHESPIFEYRRDESEEWQPFSPDIEVTITTKQLW